MFIGYLVVAYLSVCYVVGFGVGFVWGYPIWGSLAGLIIGILLIVQRSGVAEDSSEEI